MPSSIALHTANSLISFFCACRSFFSSFCFSLASVAAALAAAVAAAIAAAAAAASSSCCSSVAESSEPRAGFAAILSQDCSSTLTIGGGATGDTWHDAGVLLPGPVAIEVCDDEDDDDDDDVDADSGTIEPAHAGETGITIEDGGVVLQLIVIGDVAGAKHGIVGTTIVGDTIGNGDETCIGIIAIGMMLFVDIWSSKGGRTAGYIGLNEI